MNLHQWKKHVKDFNNSFNKNDELHQEWNANTYSNLHRFNKKNSIWQLDFKYYGKDEKCMILVGSSPCLARDIEKLKEIDENFVIICANSALKFLLRHKIKPHYVICIDSDSVDIPQHLDIDNGICNSKDITLLASTVVCGKALDNWKGPIYYLPYYSIEKGLRSKVRNRLGKAIPTGGNSITSAFYTVSVIFGSRTVIFVGNEYCFDKVKNYYADPNTAKQEKLKIMFPVFDVLGRERWTLPAHYNYAVWQEKVCTDLSPQGYFIDTSFGLLGKDCNAIHLMELSQAIGKVKWSFKMKEKLNKAKTKRERQKIIDQIRGKNDQSQVYRYDVSKHRRQILQLARS